jgi:AraC-like DNA-binding protein/quercetin dioxygenase-like cupin family protein
MREAARPRESSSALLDHALARMEVTTLLCTLQRHEQGYTMASRTLADYNFIYVTRGRVVWVVGGREHPLGPHDLVIVPPGVVHHAYGLTPAVTLGSLHVLATLPGGQDVFALLGPPLRLRIEAHSHFDRYFRGFIAEFARSGRSLREPMLPGWAHLITRELFLDTFRRGLLKPRARDPLIAELLTELEQGIGSALSLSDLARRSGFSAQHLNRLFNRTLGTTPLRYLGRLRMERAAVLLREGRLTIGEISRRVGFRDPDYFSRQFSREFARSPAAYRQLNSHAPEA